MMVARRPASSATVAVLLSVSIVSVASSLKKPTLRGPDADNSFCHLENISTIIRLEEVLHGDRGDCVCER
jgi:hypothetical protein